MAHGYLTPTKVGDKDIFRTVGDLLDRFKKEGDKNGAPPEGGSDLAVVQKAGKSKVYKEARTSNEKEQKNVNLLVTRMGGVLSNMISRGSSEEQSIGGTKKGGSFVNMGASTKPISDTTFFKSAVVEGVNPLTGEYYSPEDRIAAFKKYRPKERTTQGVGSSGGGADIVAALALNTAAVMRMENAVNRQTDNDTRISSKEIQERDRLFNRLLATRKEERLEQGTDFSGNTRSLPVGGGFGGGGFGQSGRNRALQRLDTLQTFTKASTNTKGIAQAGKTVRSASNVIGTVSKNVGKLLKTSPNALKNAFSASLKFPRLLPRALFDTISDQSKMGILGAKLSPFEQLKNFFSKTNKFDPLYNTDAAGDVARRVRGGELIDDLIAPYNMKGNMTAASMLQDSTFNSMTDLGKKGVLSPLASKESAETAVKLVGGEAAQAAAARIALAGNRGIKSTKLMKDAIVKKGAKEGLKRGSALTRMMVKNLGKSTTRSILKQIPVVAGVAGIIFGIQRALEGDFLGAGLEVTSGLLGATGTTPGLGLAIDGFLLGRDLGMMPMKKGGILHSETPVIAGEAGDEAFTPLTGAEGKIAGSVFGKASGEALANFFKKKPLEKLRYNSDHPEGINQPNPHPPGTFLYRNFERLRQMNIIDPDMKISQSHNFMPRNTNKGTALANSSEEVASGDRKNNSKNNTVIMEAPAGTDNKGNSGLPLTSNPAGGSEDQGLSMYAAHMVMASV